MPSVEVEEYSKNWFQREGNALQSMCLGFVVVILMIIVMFWNETNYVKMDATAELVKTAIDVHGCTSQWQNNNRLVYLSGCQVTQPDLTAQFTNSGFNRLLPSFDGVSLSWVTEIMQYQEVCSTSEKCEKNNNGGEDCKKVTTCECRKRWGMSKGEPTCKVESEPPRYNVGDIPAQWASGSVQAPSGSVYLSRQKQNKTEGFDATRLLNQFPSKTVQLSAVFAQSDYDWRNSLTASMFSTYGNMAKTGDDIGDIRMTFSSRSVGNVVSVAAEQESSSPLDSLRPYPGKPFDIWGRKTYDLLKMMEGNLKLDDFIEEYKSENMAVAWAFRLIVLVAMCAAFSCIYQPLSVMADLLRFLNYCTCCLGSILDKATQSVIGIVSCCSACFCFLSIFVLAWAVAHPTVVLIFVLFVMCACGAGLYYNSILKKKKSEGRELIENRRSNSFVEIAVR